MTCKLLTEIDMLIRTLNKDNLSQSGDVEMVPAMKRGNLTNLIQSKLLLEIKHILNMPTQILYSCVFSVVNSVEYRTRPPLKVVMLNQTKVYGSCCFMPFYAQSFTLVNNYNLETGCMDGTTKTCYQMLYLMT